MFDVIKEIAYFCDYKTTKQLILVYPQLKNIWKHKCYPDRYLDFYSGEENYLMEKKKEFAISITDDHHIGNFLFQYDEMLDTILSMCYSRYEYCDLLKIELRKRYLLLNKDLIIEQYNNKEEAVNYIKNKITKRDKYIIVDMSTITPYFFKYGKLSEEKDCDYKIYSIEDFK